jgi:hypothetical protein
MGIFRSHREAARANNRVIGLFFTTIAIVTLIVAVIFAISYLVR